MTFATKCSCIVTQICRQAQKEMHAYYLSEFRGLKTLLLMYNIKSKYGFFSVFPLSIFLMYLFFFLSIRYKLSKTQSVLLANMTLENLNHGQTNNINVDFSKFLT